MSDDVDAGGDPACWLHRVCDDCGAVLDDDRPHECSGRELPAPSAVVPEERDE